MYEDYTRQALPSKEYRELLGTALCVFNLNNQFVIENILRINSDNFNWYDLTDKTSGSLLSDVKKTIEQKSNLEIADLFKNLISKRNRIIHSFQITKNGELILCTKDKNHSQYTITIDYLLEFIKENQELSNKLYHLRTY